MTDAPQRRIALVRHANGRVAPGNPGRRPLGVIEEDGGLPIEPQSAWSSRRHPSATPTTAATVSTVIYGEDATSSPFANPSWEP